MYQRRESIINLTSHCYQVMRILKKGVTYTTKIKEGDIIQFKTKGQDSSGSRWRGKAVRFELYINGVKEYDTVSISHLGNIEEALELKDLQTYSYYK